MARAGVVLQNTYVLVEKLGAGGMGEVFIASHTRLQKRFAVKVLAARHSDNFEAFQRFRREAEIASRLGHPNIVEVIDFNETDDGQPFLVMELLEGEDLSARIARGPLDVAAALHVADQLASALQAAHAQDIVHRDLKPQNVFLARRGRDDAWVKVLDFGISKIKGEASMMTHSQVVIGTPGYMAPEQAEGRARETDARSDQFALAVICYEMLAGTCPFVGDSIPSTLYKIVHFQPPRIDELRPNTPAHLAGAIARAMAKRPDDRFPDVATFAAAMRGEEPVAEASPSTSTRRVVIRAGGDTASADTLMSANTEISTAGLTQSEDPGRGRRMGWVIAGAGAVAAGVVVTMLAIGGGGGGRGASAADPEPEPVAEPAPAPDAAAAAPAPAPDAGVEVAAPASPEERRGKRRSKGRRSADPAPVEARTSTSKPPPEPEPEPDPDPDPDPKPDPKKDPKKAPGEDDFITDF